MTNVTPDPLRMPGGTLITRLKVYDTPSIDGQRGGTPHVHLVCSELYFVLQGTGAVEIIDGNGFSRVELVPNSAFLFAPGTLHRLINPNGDLELLITMANSGLPERGDNVVTFSEQWLEDDVRYAGAMRVANVQEAYVRRDRGVEGFLELKRAFESDHATGKAALQRFFQSAAARTSAVRADWERVIRAGALREAERALEQITRLDQGDLSALQSAEHVLIASGEYSKPGFCGMLNRYFDPAADAGFLAEGVRR